MELSFSSFETLQVVSLLQTCHSIGWFALSLEIHMPAGHRGFALGQNRAFDTGGCDRAGRRDRDLEEFTSFFRKEVMGLGVGVEQVQREHKILEKKNEVGCRRNFQRG